MTAAEEKIIVDALHLDKSIRILLADRLLESLEEECDELSPEWEEEIGRRLESIKDGTAQFVTHEELMRSLEERCA